MIASFLWSGPIWSGVSLSADEKWNMIRRYRSDLLKNSDWTQLLDAVFTIEEKQAWQDFRQALRDIPQDFQSPDEVIFPEPPGGA